jgi:hypothetical protein
MASTSARVIGFAAAAPALAPGDADDPAGADVPADAGEPEDVPAVGVTPAACLEPKMADTMFPNTLMMSSWALFVVPYHRHAADNSEELSVLGKFCEPGDGIMQSRALRYLATMVF